MIPSIPEGWQASGHLPPFDFRHAEGQAIEWFRQDMFSVSDATGLYTVDVGWVAAGPEGTYICRLLCGMTVVLEARLSTVAEVRRWLREVFDATSRSHLN
jgi:hypothetical protein